MTRTDPIPEALVDYPTHVVIDVKWGDMDAFQHVNNTVFFRYFEVARIAYFEAVGALDGMQASGVGPILAETRCRFRRPLRFPDRVVVGARVREVGGDRFLMEYAIWSTAQGEIAATGDGLIVTYDYRNERKAPVPEAVVARMVALGARRR